MRGVGAFERPRRGRGGRPGAAVRGVGGADTGRLRGRRRGRLSQHPSAGPGPERERGRDRRLPLDRRSARRTTPTSCRMYEDLVYATPGLQALAADRLLQGRHLRGPARDVERTYSPRDDVTIVRDRFGVPRIYGASRAGAMFGAGYIAAEDRHVLHRRAPPRRPRRARLVRRRLGGQPRDGSHRYSADTPYRNDQELQVQYDLADEAYGQAGVPGGPGRDQLHRRDQPPDRRDPRQPAADARRVPAARSSGGPGGLEGHRRDLDRLPGRRDLRQGGGDEVDSALVLEAAQKRFGKRAGTRGLGATSAAPTTPRPRPRSTARRFPYMRVPERAVAALPDPGSVVDQSVVASTTARRRGGQLDRRRAAADSAPCSTPCAMQGPPRTRCSISRAESEGGAPIAVFGPRSPTSRPRSCSSRDPRARRPDWPAARRPRRRLPGHEPLRPARPRARLRLVGDLRRPGHHRQLRGQALRPRRLGSRRSTRWATASTASACRSTCSSGSTPGPSRPATPPRRARRPTAPSARRSGSSPTGRRSAASRTRSRSCARPTTTRSTRRSASPTSTTRRRWSSPAEFMKAACRIQYTFNWFYIDRKHIAYFNSGINPVRAKRAHPDLPVPAKLRVAQVRAAVAGAARRRADRPDQRQTRGPTSRDQEPCKAHPQVVDQRLHHELEQQAGARLPRSRRRLLARAGVPVDPARRPDPQADQGQEADDACRSWSTRWRRPAPSTCAATSRCPTRSS